MAQAARLASRLQRELRMLQSDPPPGVSAWPFNDHLLTHLQAQIDGPQGTVYANGVFKLDIQVPERYPFEPPNIKFVTPVYHPNIDNGGRICLDILNLPPKGAWRPSLNLSTLLASIGLLLAEPNPDDGLMGEITAEYKHDKLSFDIKAKKWTELYARQDQVTLQLNEPKTSSNTQSNQNCTTSGVHGQEPMQAARSNEEHMSSTCGVLSQPLKFGLSLSKRLALNRGVASLQQNKAASSAASQGQITQIQHTEASDQISSLFGSGSEGTGLQAKACRSQILKEPGEQSKNELASGTCDVTSLDRKKPPSHLDDNVERLSRDSNKSLSNEMAAGSSNTPLDAAIALLERSAGVRKSSRPDGSCSSPPVSVSAKVLSNNLVNEGECWNQSILRKKVQACKNVSVDKENRSPKHCPAMKPKSVISPLSVAEKKMAELQPMEVSGNVNSSMSTCINSAHGYGGKERGHLCLPSRTKSLKLTRARLDVQPLHATTVQQSVQSIPIEKKQTSPIIIPDDVPTVVVSDSGSESELSDEGFTLSLTQRSLINKRKANSKLR